MIRKTELEEKFVAWARDNGGEVDYLSGDVRCKHPNGNILRFGDPAFKGSNGDVVVPWSTSDNDKDPIMYKHGGSPNFNGIELDGDTITFLDRDEYKYVEIKFTEDGFSKVDEGTY